MSPPAAPVTPRPRLDRGDALALGAVMMTVAVVYLRTLAPSVTGEDAGELAAAAWLGGVAHPPGYPLWCLLARAFAFLPIGDVAYRINMFSAFCGVLTAGLLYVLARSWALGRSAAAVGALGLAFSLRFWSQCVITEVYTLNVCLFVALLLCLTRWRQDGGRWRWFYAAALLYGLALANHYMLTLLVSPAYLFYAWEARHEYRRQPRVLALAALLVLPGLLCYAYLPLAASRQPYVNWGDPSNLERFLAHVRRTSYATLEQGRTIDPGAKLLFLGHLVLEIWAQFTPYLLVPMVWGGVWLWSRRRLDLLVGLGVVLLNTVVLIWLLQFTPEYVKFRVFEPYYLPAYAVLALCLAAGCQALVEQVRTLATTRRWPAWAPGLAAAAALFLPLLPLAQHWRTNDRSSSWIAHDFAASVLRQVEPDAIIFPWSDNISFPLLYLQGVERQRPDVLLADKCGDLDRATVELYAALPDVPEQADAVEVMRQFILKSGRPVYCTDRPMMPPVPGYRLAAWGLLYRVVPQADPPRPPSAVWEAVRLRNVEAAWQSHDDMDYSLAVAHSRMRAEHELSYGERERGHRLLLEAEARCYQKEELNDLGIVYDVFGFAADARRAWSQALLIYPGYVAPHLNLARQALKQGDPAGARRWLAAALAVAPRDPGVQELAAELNGGGKPLPPDVADSPPDNPIACNDLACRLANQRRFSEAVKLWRAAIALDPDCALAHQNLVKVYTEELFNPAQAEFHRRELARLRPAAPPPAGLDGPPPVQPSVIPRPAVP